MKLHLALIESWRARWNALGSRERRALAVVGGFVGIVLCYFVVWNPVEGGVAAARVRHAAVQSQLSQVREQAVLVEKLRRGPRIAQTADALAAAEQAAARHGLRERVKRIDPEGARAVRIQIEAAPFAAVIAWLVELQQQGVRAETASFERQSSPGLVNARLVLRVQGP
jgi:general secretion pathway protein M